jgi:hypothetical protein
MEPGFHRSWVVLGCMEPRQAIFRQHAGTTLDPWSMFSRPWSLLADYPALSRIYAAFVSALLRQTSGSEATMPRGDTQGPSECLLACDVWRPGVIAAPLSGLKALA